MKRPFRAFTVFALFFAICAARASAGETTVDLSLGPLIGTHAEGPLVDTVAPVPIPILAIAHRESNFELFAEGLPVSPPITSSSPESARRPGESIATNLAFENAVVRAYLLHDRLSIGAGETLYNQQSLYKVAYRKFTASDQEASRVAGGRYEIVGLPCLRCGLRIALDLDPALHGRVTSTTFPYSRYPVAYELGSQSEVNVSYRRRFTHTQIEYGVRYINYVAHFSPGGEPADRNTGIRPYVSYGLHIGG